jgi:hypothetical protein
MPYTLKLTNGNTLVTVPDQTVDQKTTSLTLIGKNSNAYGTSLNDNFVSLLENFASGNEPRAPLVGQLWFNTIAGRMYYFNENYQFRPVGGPIVASTQPSGLVQGDLWIDTTAQQLKYFDGTNLNVAGPLYSAVNGKAGWIVETYQDRTLANHVVSTLYNNGTIIAILSESAFTPSAPINGITTVTPGVNLAPGYTFNGTATNAIQVGNLSTSSFVFKGGDSMFGGLAILSNAGLQVGANSALQLYVDNITGNTISSNTVDGDLTLQVAGIALGGDASAIRIKAGTKQIGVWTDTPTAGYGLTVNTSTIINGALTVLGTTTFITSTVLQVESQNIELAYPGTADVNLDGAGIILMGTSNHTILYRNALYAWEFNNNINIKAPNSLLLDGTAVFQSGGLGLDLVNVVGAPNLTTVGTLTNITVGNITITTSTINTADGFSDLTLQNASIGNINVGGKKVYGARPTLITDSTSTLATKGYVDTAQQIVGSSRYVFTVDVTGRTNPSDYIISNFLDIVLPPVDPRGSIYNIPDQAEARVITLNYVLPSLTANATFNGQYTTVDKGGIQNSQSVVYAAGVSVATVAGQAPVCVQQILRFYVTNKVWVYDRVIS